MKERLLRAGVMALTLAVSPAALAKDAAPAAPSAAAAPEAKAPSAGMAAARDRQKKCGGEWRALSDAEKAKQGPKWPQFWSQCNKRLKGADKA